MDQKSWLWKKRSTEKTLIADKASNSSRKCEDEVTEVHKMLIDKTDLERELQTFNEKLSYALSECDAKDSIAMKQAKIAEEAISGWEKAETETISLKQELDKVLQQKTDCEERTSQLDAALKECMHQLRFVREENEKRIQYAVLKTSQEYEKIKIALDEKLAEAGKNLAKLETKNTQLTKALSVKEKSIEDLSRYKIQVDADFNAIRSRVESTEKENACLKYDVRVLENEEREFNRRTGDVAQKQNQESVKRIAKLETECQRLCLLVRKYLPGPVDFGKMKGEVELLEKDRVEVREKKSNLSPTSSSTEFLEGQTNVERGKKLCLLQEKYSLTAFPGVGSDDKASCAESWASALITELEHFKNEKELKTPSHGNMRISDMNLMDDFAEMEKLASDDVIQTSTNKTMNLDQSDARNGNKIVSVSIQKILELLEGINVQSQDKGVGEFFDDKFLSYKTLENPTGYTVRVFQWKSDELSGILQQFVRTCNDLLNGTVDLEYFVREVASNLEWVINHCFSIQDVSSMKDAIMSRLDWDEWRSESDVDSGWANYSAECNKLPIFRQNMSYIPMVSRLNGNNDSCQMDEEGRIWKVEHANKELEIVTCESKDVIEDLYSEIETMKKSEGDIGNEIEKQKIMKEDLEIQVMETNDELRKACLRISDLENELQNKTHSCKRLEETCHDLKIQLKSIASKELPDNGKQWEKQLQNDWEITAASEKLAECQETILNLGKQLKALASPSDAPLFDKVISTPADSVITSSSTPRKNISRRSCLLGKMLVEDDNLQIGASNETEKDIENGNGDSGVSNNGGMKISSEFINGNGIINHEDKSESDIASLDNVPCKRNGGRGFFKKSFWRQKKGNRGKNILLIGCN